MATIPGLRNLITEAEANRVKVPATTDENSAPSKFDDGRYDGKKREPQFANAENSCLWEIVSSPVGTFLPRAFLL